MAVTDFKDKVAAITGAGSGMGQALAILLAQRGCHLSLADVNERGLQSTVDQIGTAVTTTVQRVDMADRAAVEAWAAATVADHGRANLIFNNAGVSVTGNAEQMPYEDMQWLMNINFWGVVYGCRAFLPYLHEVPEAAVVNTSSIFGSLAFPTQSIYNASKFAVRGYTYALRQELKNTGIGVSCVQPGGVKTNIVRASRIIPTDNTSANRDDFIQRFDELAGLTSLEAAERILKGVLKNKAQIL
ncbi:MAG: SDR family NAD(P)-dependent oxidoreductase, partial [Proteobacteria bacterium]|nr:SDR family NAD(P)-dependent oxidoreductase [Pseudomonadota bacterium]